MTKVIFIGSFLSLEDGSLSYAESLEIQLRNSGVDCILKSRASNKLLRLCEIVISLVFFRGDVVHIDVFSDKAFIITEIASLIGSCRRKRIILTLRGGKLIEFYEGNESRVKGAFKRASILQSPSQFLTKQFYDKGFKIKYLPNAVDMTKFKYERSFVNKHSILWVRAFTDIYNPCIAVESLYLVLKKYPDATLTMIGPDKGLLLETERLIKKLDISRSVRILGPIPNQDLNEYYQNHEVYINTTSYESFGLAVLEAAACGVPVVSNKVGEIPYIWTDAENILLTEHLSPMSFALKIMELFDNPELAINISIAARRRAEEYDWDKIRPSWIELLSSH
jgi:glycosyltransferase involved in cell wall biosynthesis